MTPEPRLTRVEEVCARAVFAPLGGLVVLATVATAPPATPLADLSAAAFSSAHGNALDLVLEDIRAATGFTPAGMQLFEEMGWHRDPDFAVRLPQWLQRTESPPLEADDPVVRARLVSAGRDFQFSEFLTGLVSAALTLRPGPPGGQAEPIVRALRGTARLSGLDQDSGVRAVFRIWRVARLGVILTDGHRFTRDDQDRWRTYGQRIGALIGQP
ncbi:hypothetical protein ACL02R_16130 [Streptomyces sp. MS19]|uniref:hypothetical protein n=1 Tax=Streptomyces sp. MS19 TaxID=3385972 RepID=UPI0039A3366E